MTLKICVAQLNFIVGDLSGNAQKIRDAAHQAHAQGARLLLTPELSLCGYAAEDLYLRPAFMRACDDALKSLAAQLAGLQDMCVVVGHPQGDDQRGTAVSITQRFNCASVLREGQVVATYAKQELPNYQVFDERRYFAPGSKTCVFEAGPAHALVRVGLLICEDAWFAGPALAAKAAGAQLLAVINASPFHLGKGYQREQAMAERCRSTDLPLAYAHLVGGQDELVFEGRSFVLDAQGLVQGRAASFQESLFVCALESSSPPSTWTATTEPQRSEEADLWDALVLGVRDYVEKKPFPWRIAGPVGRDRFGAGTGYCGRCTGCR